MRKFFEAMIDWSTETFGPAKQRGPKGPLLHLRKEVEEALRELRKDPTSPRYVSELADLQFLVFDAVHRSGLDYEGFKSALWAKLAVNEAREWPDWRLRGDEPIEHIRK